MSTIHNAYSYTPGNAWNPKWAYCVEDLKSGRFLRTITRERISSAHHFCGAAFFGCFNDAVVFAERARSRGRRCFVRCVLIEQREAVK